MKIQSFCLLTQPWVDTVDMNGRFECLSLSELIGRAADLADIIETPATRLAILRLLLAVTAVGDVSGNWDIYDGFLHVTGLPESSARSARAILDMQDGRGVALSPDTDPDDTSHATTAKALLSAFMCDRGGLKARVPGLPISGVKPMCMGQLIAFRHGSTLADFLELNAIEPSDWVPWWQRPVDYEEAWGGSMAHYLLWPWRRVQVTRPGQIVVAAGQKFSGLTDDPWSLGRASLRHLNGIECDYAADVTAIVLNQALPVAAWTTRVAAKSTP